MKKVLVLQLKRIGDVLLTGPAIARLHEAWPDARISLMTCDAAGAIANWIPGVDQVLNFRRRSLNPAFWRRFLAGGPYDVVLDYNANDRAAFMSLLSRAPVRATYSKHRRRFPRNRIYTHGSDASLKDFHTVDHMAALLETIGVEGPVAPLHLRLPEPVRAEAGRLGLPPRYALIHPGTARSEKYWRPERWGAVIDHLSKAHDLPCVVTGATGEEESAHLAAIAQASKAGFSNLAGRTSLPVAAAVIERATLAATVDTAALHFAAGFGVPQVALFGPTNPFRWRPINPRSMVVQAGHEAPKGPDADFERANRFQPMNTIETGTVLEAIDRVLAQTSSTTEARAGG